MTPNDIINDPTWLPVALAANRAVVFRKLADNSVAESTFLDNRAVGMSTTAQVKLTDLVQISQKMESDKTIYQLFHISHVGSTLLAKVVQSIPSAVSFREPTIFRDIVSRYYDHIDGTNDVFAKEMPLILCSIYNMFRRGGADHIFIKHTSGNLILPPIVDEALPKVNVETRDALLYTTAKDFLSHAITSKGLYGDAVAPGSSQRRVGYFNRLCTFRKLELADLKPLQKVGLVWMTEMQKLRARSATLRPDSVINFDACLREGGKEAIVKALIDAYDLSEHEGALTDSPAWDANSKNGEPFNPGERTQKLEKNYLKEKIEVEKTLKWIRSICAENVTFAPLSDDLQ